MELNMTNKKNHENKGFVSTLRGKPLVEKCLKAAMVAVLAAGIAAAPARPSTLFSPGLWIQDTEKSMLANPLDYTDFTRKTGNMRTARIGLEGYGMDCLDLRYSKVDREDCRVESQRIKFNAPLFLIRLHGEEDTDRDILDTNPIKRIMGHIGVDMSWENYFFNKYHPDSGMTYGDCRQLSDLRLNYGLAFAYDLFANDDSLEQGVASKYLFSRICFMAGLDHSKGITNDFITGSDAPSLSHGDVDEYTASMGLHLGIPAANIFGDRDWIDQWSPYSQFLSLSPYMQYTEGIVNKASSVRLGIAVRMWIFELRAEEMRRSDGTQERITSFAVIAYDHE